MVLYFSFIFIFLYIFIFRFKSSLKSNSDDEHHCDTISLFPESFIQLKHVVKEKLIVVIFIIISGKVFFIYKKKVIYVKSSENQLFGGSLYAIPGVGRFIFWAKLWTTQIDSNIHFECHQKFLFRKSKVRKLNEIFINDHFYYWFW